VGAGSGFLAPAAGFLWFITLDPRVLTHNLRQEAPGYQTEVKGWDWTGLAGLAGLDN